MVVFSQTNSVTPLFYSIYLRKLRLYMIYSNLKNFSLFNFEIFQLIHCYSQILGVSLEPCRRSICLLFQISFIVTAILRRFTVTLYFYHKNNAYIFNASYNFVEVMGVSSTWIGFFQYCFLKIAKYLYTTAP